MGAGKSSFINSLEFSLKGTQSQPTGDKGKTQGTHTTIRGCLPLTDHISLFDSRGMNDFSISYVDDIMNGIGYEKEEPSQSSRLLDEEIHCPVFVYKHGGSGMEEAVEFLDKFARRLRAYNGYQPMVVVTHADGLSPETRKDLKENFSESSMEVWFFENYQSDSVENRVESIRFLKFLKAVLHQCEVSVVNMERRKKLKKPKTWLQWLTRQ